MNIVQLPARITPRTPVTIYWEVDGCSGSTTCQAWRGQYEIDRLQSAGYIIRHIGVN